MKKRGAAVLLAAVCLLVGCAASDPALPAETSSPTETSSPAYQGDSLFAYCTERQRELLELPHEELPVELIFHHWTETAADYKLVAGRNFIGRAAAMDVSLADDDTVSRESHALVTYDAKHNSFSLSPGQGRGITYCNEEQVEMVRPLNAYDVIEVGKSQLIFLPLCGEKFQWNEE